MEDYENPPTIASSATRSRATCLRISLDVNQQRRIDSQSGFRAGLSLVSNNRKGGKGLKNGKDQKNFLLEFYREGLEIGKFLLKQSDGNPPPATPMSDYTGSDAVSQQVAEWIKVCDCVGPAETPFHPTRLVDIQSLKEPKISSDKPLQEVAQWRTKRVRLVDSQDLAPGTNRYVTLSHCWGNPKVPPLKLLKANKDDFMAEEKGIELKKLPLTFRHAIDFASRLDEARYVWIDSLCIIQDDGDDWLSESREMDNVYSNSFLNISATAAKNGDEGLFDLRHPPLLWPDEIDLNVDGIPGMTQGRNPHPIHRCTVLDASFWDNYIDRAPLNRRGWVLQERLMAPRNVHFCKGQVAWECQEGRKSERHPDDFPTLEGETQELVSGEILKYLRPECLSQETPDLSRQGTALLAYKFWKQIVERYTRAKFTNPGDKLIALSGVAQRMHLRIESAYVAGLWRKDLESQLLWCVEPVWDPKRQQFSYPSSRPKEYRAPSFSWAAVDADQGVTYGELLDDGILIKVERVESPDFKGNRMFGKVTEGCLEVTGDLPLKKVELSKTVQDNGVEYRWRLVGKEGMHANKFTIVYLDSPEGDSPEGDVPEGVTDICGPTGRIYCLPAASACRGSNSGDMTCLLLQADDKEHGTFRRVGLTIISVLDDKGEENMRNLVGYEHELPCTCCEPGSKRTVKEKHMIRMK